MNGLEYKQQYDSKEFCQEKEAPNAILGALYTPEETWFRVWVPNAKSVAVNLYNCGTADESSEQECGLQRGLIQSLPMKTSERVGEGTVWEALVTGNLHGLYYTYEVCRDGECEECVDIYTKACGANGQRGMVVDLALTDPEGWEEDKDFIQTNPNTVIYELHVKDFSYHHASGISQKHKGKYLAFTENTNGSTGVRYLKELGITHVHLLPVFDFASVDETVQDDQFNWGYDPLHYNVPEGSYATDAFHGEVRIKEFKQMVQALHQAGISVIMDVVYNHTYSANSNFQVLAPYYYYRQNEDGTLSDGSACGNETASERTMFAKFMKESVLYWVEEYHIDGFRFDLMGLHDTQILNSIRAALDRQYPHKNILVYGEPWIAHESPMKEGFSPAVKTNVHLLDNGISIFSDDTRDAIKGSVFYEDKLGFVNGAENLEKKIASAYQAWCDGGHDFEPLSPRQIISYVSVHDNLTLWDKLVLSRGKNDFAAKYPDIMAMNKLAAGIVFTCLGTPLMQAGEEFARTKNGDENSYESSAFINCLDWERRAEFDDLVEYYKGLIALRGNIPLYHNQTEQTWKDVHILYTGDNRVEVCLDLSYYNCKWKKIYIVANASGEEVETVLPPGVYQKLVDKKSSWQWKKSIIWSKIKKVTRIVQTPASSIGIWGEIKIKKESAEMDFIEKIGETIITKGKEVTDKAKELAEIANLKGQIYTCQEVIKKNYKEMGKIYFEQYGDIPEEPFEKQCRAIKNAKNGIKELQEKIDEIKNEASEED